MQFKSIKGWKPRKIVYNKQKHGYGLLPERTSSAAIAAGTPTVTAIAVCFSVPVRAKDDVMISYFVKCVQETNDSTGRNRLLKC